MLESRQMQRILVQSSVLKSVGYDAERSTLEIEFHDGTVYRYYGVSAIVHRDLLAAASIGQYYAFFIKTSFRCERVA